MNLNTVSRLATQMYRSGKCYYFKSSPGIGKSSIVVDSVPHIARETVLNLGLVVINAPLLTPADAVGYLIPKHHADGRVESVYTQPFWWVTSEGKRLEQYDGGVIFVDEMDKGDLDVKKALGELALSGRIGPHEIPKGWVVWMAGNRSQDRSGSTKELDHLINRRCEIEITPDLMSWETWALKHGVHPAIIAFANQNPQIVFPETVPEKQGPFCTPRSLVATGEMLSLMTDDDDLPTTTDAIELASGYIGQAASAQLFATLRLAAELPPLDQIIASPATCKVPQKPDAQMLVCYNLAARVDTANLPPIIKYVERLPADFAITFAKAATTRLPSLVIQPAMMDWARRNNSLMTTLNVIR
jgi:hypothetical protein